MSLQEWKKLRHLSLGLASVTLLAASPMAFAHAILVRSSPADHSVVHTRGVDFTLQYNSRIDAARSTLTFTDATGKALPLQPQPPAMPGQLKATARNLPNGSYRIHWQVLASDGHITRGDVDFSVDAK